MPDAKPIRGRLTRLTPVSERDLDLLAGWFADPEFVERWGGVPLSREEVAAKYVGRRRPDVEGFIVVAEEAPVGYAQYWTAAGDEGGMDMVLLPSAQGRGLGPDAVRALVQHLFEDRGWRRITVDPDADDVRAVRAWGKAGFCPVRHSGGTFYMERIAGVDGIEE